MPKLASARAAGGVEAPAKKAATAKKAAPARRAPANPTPRAAEPKPSLLDSARSLADIEDFLNVLWTGDSGTGKTAAIAAMANIGPTIIINAEGGLRKTALRKRGVDVDNIRVLPEDPAQLSHNYLDDLFWEIKHKLEQDPTWITGIGWDSVTEVVIKLVENSRDAGYEKALESGKDRDPFFIALEDYGTMTNQMRQLLRRYRDLPCHFGVTALLRRDVDNESKVVYRPAVNPGLANDLVGYMDIVCVTQVANHGGEEDEYRGLFRPAGMHRGKDRFDVFPRTLIDPTFDRLLDYVKGDLEASTDPLQLAAKARRQATEPVQQDPTGAGAGEAGDE